VNLFEVPIEVREAMKRLCKDRYVLLRGIKDLCVVWQWAHKTQPDDLRSAVQYKTLHAIEAWLEGWTATYAWPRAPGTSVVSGVRSQRRTTRSWADAARSTPTS